VTTRVWQGMFVAAVAILAMPAVRGETVTYEMVTVGDAGNANDSTGYGAVAYGYQIGKYEVTIGQYTAFLNAVAKSDPYSLYSTSMANDLNTAGISRSGSSGAYSYSVIGDSVNRPISYVSWYDAARFANWMQNGQGNGGTETGAYTLNGAMFGGAVARNSGAAFYLPTENEWYKAAYYSPVKGGVGSPGYFRYAMQSDSVPGNVVGYASNQANYNTGVAGGYSVTQSTVYSSEQNYLTDVGSFVSSASYYGTFDQTGNVTEWNDLSGAAGITRGIRGGEWYTLWFTSDSSSRDTGAASDQSTMGFRLAGPAQASPVPEIDPAGLGSVLALVTGALGLLERRRAGGA